jgi:hypothetical protein
VGSPGLHLHDLRHAGNALAPKVPGTTIRDLMGPMGHDSTRAAMIYLHGSPGADRIIADALPSSSISLRRNDHAMQAGREPAGPRGQIFRRRELGLVAVGVPCVVAAAVFAGFQAAGIAHLAGFVLQVLGVALLVGGGAPAGRRWREARRRK